MEEKYPYDTFLMNDMKKNGNNGHVRIEPNEEEEEDFSWKKVLYEFSQSTTLSGVNKITEATPFRLRRLLWILLVVCGTAAFVYQVCLSFVYYYSWPVSVNVRVNYNSTISFPAVTICNQNAFRISKSVEHGVYEELTEAFSSRGVSDIVNKTALAMSMTEIYNKTSHTMEDMVLSCTWDTKPCKPNALSRRITDHGYCVTFNGNKQTDPDHVVYRRGSSGGLSLKLNIEQYEYMGGPQQGAGIQMLMHDSGSMPEVANLGQMFPPGIQASIGLSIKKIINLEPPYGVCVKNRKLDYYPEYSLGSCKTEGLQKILRQKCGCRDPYMADDGETPVCTLEQYVMCLKPSIDEFSANLMNDTCEIPCVQTIYEPTVSFGALSRFDLEKMLAPSGSLTEHIVNHYHHALEVRQRVDEDIIEADRKQLTLLDEALDAVTKNFEDVGVRTAEAGIPGLEFADRLIERLDTIRFGPLRLNEFIMQYNFVRGYVLLKERRLSLLTTNPYGFPSIYAENMKLLMDNETTTAVKEAILHKLINEISVKRTFARISKDNMTSIFDGYANGTTLNNYKMTRVVRYDNIFNASCVHPLSSSNHYFIKRLIRYFGYLVYRLNDMEVLATKATNGTGAEAEKVDALVYKYKKYMRQMNSDFYKLENRVVNTPLETVQAKIREFETMNRTIRDSRMNLLLIRAKMMNISGEVEPNYQKKLSQLSSMIKHYLADDGTTKLDLAKFSGDDLQESVNAVGRTLWSIPVNFHTFAAKYRELIRLAEQAYKVIFNEHCMWSLLEQMRQDIRELYTNGTLSKTTKKVLNKLLEQSTKNYVDIDKLTVAELEELMNVDLLDTSYEGILNVTEEIESQIRQAKLWFHSSEQTAATLRDRFRDFSIDMRKYVKMSKIDHDFLKDNILKVNIYLRELSYSETEQQKAYEMTRLWSDVGGSMGLFIGASALTGFEILDFLIHSFFVWRRVRHRQKKQKKVKANGTSAV